ncbi:MAG: hypothetical protein AB1921_11345 [Thermodesulfobacteriota bacterium]
MTPESIQALSILRDPSQFQWYILIALGLVLYAYASEIRHRNWDAVLMGLLFSAGELLWEMINSLILHFTGFSSLWTTPGSSAYLILSGLNIEIFFLFSLAGVVLVLLLQAFDDQPEAKVLGVSYKIFVPLCLGLLGVFVECFLNRAGALVWVYRFWNFPHIWIIAINYLTPFFLCAWGHFALSRQTKKRLLAVLAAANVVCWVVFAQILQWI